MANKGLKMIIDRSFRDPINLTKKIPLHYQKTYLANISNGSFNATRVAGVYKTKIKKLLQNNRVLALALQDYKAKKEELMEETKSNANIITFSRLKLASLSDSLKKIVAVVDETLALLQMHSSVSSSKFTPKNTQSHEEFKEQVKGVAMDFIPEDQEFESPQEMPPNQTNNEIASQNKKLTDPQSEGIFAEIQTDISGKDSQPTEELHNCKKILGPSKLKKKTLKEKTKKNGKTAPSHGTNHEYCKSVASVYKYEESSPAKIASMKSKKLLNKNKFFTSEVSHKTATKSSTASKIDNKASENIVWKNAKRVKNVNNKENASPLNGDEYQNKLHSDNNILEIQKPEDNGGSTNKNLDVACTLKNSVPSIKLRHNNASNSYVISHCEKENKTQKMSAKKLKSFEEDNASKVIPECEKKNKNSNETQKMSAKKLKSFEEDNVSNVIPDCEKENKNSNRRQKMSVKNLISLEEDDLAPTTTKKRNNGHSSALKSLSSKINTENSKESRSKSKAIQIDDLITTKSALLVRTTHRSESYDDSRSYLQDLSLKQQEMVKNLAENTVLVTAEVHKSSELLETDKMKFRKAEPLLPKQPVVLLKDIFQSGKSFCKSISREVGGDLNSIPLELQLLEHCSSLKVIPEESLHSQDNSSDLTEDKAQKRKIENIEPPLSFEDEVMDQTLYEKKKMLRKRSACVNYREPSLNRKQRR